jgi:hypothetical protein
MHDKYGGRRGDGKVGSRKARAGGSGEHKVTRNNVYHNCGCHDHWARDSRQPRHGGAAHMAQAEEDGEPTLFLVHASPVLRPRGKEIKGEAQASPHSNSTLLLTYSTLLHIDETRA